MCQRDMYVCVGQMYVPPPYPTKMDPNSLPMGQIPGNAAPHYCKGWVKRRIYAAQQRNAAQHCCNARVPHIRGLHRAFIKTMFKKRTALCL